MIPATWTKYGEIYCDDDFRTVFVCTDCMKEAENNKIPFHENDLMSFWNHIEKCHLQQDDVQPLKPNTTRDQCCQQEITDTIVIDSDDDDNDEDVENNLQKIPEINDKEGGFERSFLSSTAEEDVVMVFNKELIEATEKEDNIGMRENITTNQTEGGRMEDHQTDQIPDNRILKTLNPTLNPYDNSSNTRKSLNGPISEPETTPTKSNNKIPYMGYCVICHHCENSFYFREEFQKHVRTYQGVLRRIAKKRLVIDETAKPYSEIRPHKCSICEKCFCHEWQLNNHIKGVHNKKQRLYNKFRCTFCGFSCTTEGPMKNHIRNHTNIQAPKIIESGECKEIKVDEVSSIPKDLTQTTAVDLSFNIRIHEFENDFVASMTGYEHFFPRSSSAMNSHPSHMATTPTTPINSPTATFPQYPSPTLFFPSDSQIPGLPFH